MRVLVTGSKGQLGYDTVNELNKKGHEAVGVDIEEMDITKLSDVKSALYEIQPEAVIHCAAWTAVDAAEDFKEKVYLVNETGTKNIALVCKELDIKMMYISTDYVFNGEGTTPWEPDNQNYQPVNIYGESKLAGEQVVTRILNKYFVVRISWAFGLNGGNFIKTMLCVGADREQINVVNDQIGTPTYTYDLAKLLVDMIESEKYGYYHATNEGGYISWYEFAKEIFRQASELGCEKYDEDHLRVIPVTTEEYGVSRAKRPFNSRLDKRKLTENGFERLPEWKDALTRYLHNINF